MADHASTQPVTQPTAPRFRARPLLGDIRVIITTIARLALRKTILLPGGLVWRESAILLVLIDHAERTGGDPEILRQARSVHRRLLHLQGQRRTVHERPISSRTFPSA
ncbi:MAG TPA: hypothetical protein VFZ66_07200 [Herpetosiphonaceae bacterium]